MILNIISIYIIIDLDIDLYQKNIVFFYKGVFMEDFIKIGDGLDGSCLDLNEICNTCLDSIDDMEDYLRNLNSFLYAYTYLKYKRNLYDIYKLNNLKIGDNPSSDLVFSIARSYKMEVCEGCANNCNETIDMCLRIIDKECCKKLSLDELASRVHISKNYLSFLFKREVGLSFNKYINLRRVDQAKRMIMANESLDQVAYACGYSSQAHFSANFKKYTGLCPKDFKKENAG